MNKTFIHLAIIMVVGLLIYSNTLEVPFIYDDEPNIISNPTIKDLRYFTDSSTIDASRVDQGIKLFFRTRFIGYLSLAINYRLNGLNVAGYHLFNLLVHIVNTVLLYRFIILTLNTPFFSGGTHLKTPLSQLCALFGALLFTSHPVQTQAVTYIIQRFASLAATFYLLTVVMYITAMLSNTPRTRYALYAISVISSVCAMKTKEIAFTVPVTIAIYEFMFLGGSLKKRVMYLTPLFMTMLIIPLTLIGNNASFSGVEGISGAIDIASTRDISRWHYLITQFRVIVMYIRLLFLPINQSLLYDYPVYRTFFNMEILASLLLIVSLMGLAIRLYILSGRAEQRRYLRLGSFGITWFFVTLSVESGIIAISDIIYEHRLYLPMVGFCFVFVCVYIMVSDRIKNSERLKTKWIVTATVILIILSLAAATYNRNGLWHSRISLWSDVVKKYPNNADSQSNAGCAYHEAGFLKEALNHYQAAIRLNPNDAKTHNNIGAVYVATGFLNEALTHYQAAIRLNPNDAKTHNNIGVVYVATGFLNEALTHYQAAIRLDFYDAKIHRNLGELYNRQNKLDEAIAEYQNAIRINPDYVAARNNLGNVYVTLGRNEEAIKEFQAVLRLNPQDTDARRKLDSLIKTTGMQTH
ncbi:MAG: tetratricopeptide repeat protein [Nitrospirae bacterium]|nr:tetratricopeptide repeat protein [Nitrospirota bacterium]